MTVVGYHFLAVFFFSGGIWGLRDNTPLNCKTKFLRERESLNLGYSQMMEKVNIFWFRRDLRLHDNHGLHEALNNDLPVLPVFIFDAEILGRLQQNDARVAFIYSEVIKIKRELEKQGSSLLICYGNPQEIFRRLIRDYEVIHVFANGDYEPYALERDREVEELLGGKGIGFGTFKDHVIFEKDEVLKDDGKPYTVFTPYSKKWKLEWTRQNRTRFPSETMLGNMIKTASFPVPELKEMGFKHAAVSVPSRDISEATIRNYARNRDFPAIEGTTRVGVHLRFGTVSIRALTQKVQEWSETFLNELIWREFYSSILWHFPHVVDSEFKSRYDFVRWRNNENEFDRWCRGETGYPMVDAGMRELNETGFMHNRVRMITAGFLTKHLLIDWRWGEAYFAEKLLDFELASNNGNWQWAAGTGCDAAPYFRIFNPETQQKKFDPRGAYLRKWVPEAFTLEYPQPVVAHKFARERALSAFKKALQ